LVGKKGRERRGRAILFVVTGLGDLKTFGSGGGDERRPGSVQRVS